MDAAQNIKIGHCLCGACRFELRGPHLWVGHCYCESCRRATASPMTTFLGHPDGAWRWSGTKPRSYQSSPGTTRGFCETCGTPMFFAATKFPNETHFYVATLTDPLSVQPDTAYHTDERLSWLAHGDDTPT